MMPEVQERVPLKIGDGSDWVFSNGAWIDQPGQGITVAPEARRTDGPAMQGHHYAFHRGPSFADVQATFEIQLAGHTDIGIVLRASDAAHFYVLHFPNCGQGSRAQHFWVALSKMDQRGYLQCIKLELVRRVPSNSGLWLTVEMEMVGSRITAQIGKYGHFEAEDTTYSGPGRIGLFGFVNNATAEAGLRNLVVAGTPVDDVAWDATQTQPQNWFYPCPDQQHGAWQRPADLIRFPDGELLLSYSVQEQAHKGAIVALVARSHDAGWTWTQPEPLQLARHDAGWEPDRIHLTPGGRLICLRKSKEGYVTAESSDRGQTWSDLVSAGLSPAPPNMSGIHLGPQAFLNLADGTIVLLAYGARPDLNKEGLTIHTWGSHHCQAFACRSTDDGRTWTNWCNLDNAGINTYADPADPGRQLGQAVEGNLDLTEICAAETADGEIIALIRPIYSPWMWETRSTDGGLTWSPCMRGPFPGYATPNMLRTQAGALLVAHRMPTMTVNISHDDGFTWNAGTLIDSAIWVMGAMVETEPDVVLYIYWDSFESLMRGQKMHITPAGIVPIRPPHDTTTA